MGISLCKYIFGRTTVRTLILGLDAAGKTTILYTLKLGQIITTIPTVGFNVETLHFKNVDMTAWDIGVRDRSRPLYRHYFPNTQGLVYVVDSSDRERCDEALEELQTIMKEEDLRELPVLILANKQDIDKTLTPDEIRQKIQDKKCMCDRHWEVFGVTGTHENDRGLQEAFKWFENELVEREKCKMASGLLSGASIKAKNNNTEKSEEKETEKNTKPLYCSFIESFKKMVR